MIQLATDPNASRPSWRPAPAEAKDNTVAGRRQRSGHAWPFMTRYAEQAPSSQETKRTPTSGSGA
jgi:hypothetical protein